jgi:hypothetical protein
VLLPVYEDHSIRHLFSEEFDVIDLYEMADRGIANYDYHDWRFVNNAHWNEAGNQLAASYLYRVIEHELGLSPMSTDALKEEVHTYYAAFDGWMPDDSFTKRPSDLSHKKKQSIRSKYDGVEIER